MDAQNIWPASADKTALNSEFKMIDVGDKTPTRRRAIAEGRLFARSETLERIRSRTLPKGDVLVLAEIAGIQAAKRTADLLPLCHPLPLESVRVFCCVEKESVRVTCEAVTTAKTGVEMEALSGVNGALLCIWDLTKGIDPDLALGEIFLKRKEGGKSGVWVSARESQSAPRPYPAEPLAIRVGVLTVSDRCSRGEAEDRSGPEIESYFRERKASELVRACVPDEKEKIAHQVQHLARELCCDLIVATGGTGLSPRDVTPEAMAVLAWKPIPGLGELLRKSGSHHTPMAWLSRSEAGIYEKSLVILLPGSVKAVREGLEAISPLLSHAVHVARGGDHPR